MSYVFSISEQTIMFANDSAAIIISIIQGTEQKITVKMKRGKVCEKIIFESNSWITGWNTKHRHQSYRYTTQGFFHRRYRAKGNFRRFTSCSGGEREDITSLGKLTKIFPSNVCALLFYVYRRAWILQAYLCE